MTQLLVIASTVLLACVSQQPPSRPQPPRPGGQPAQRGQPQQPAPIVVDPPLVQLGRVTPSSKHPVRFTIRNITSAPVKILDARPSCKCTTLESLAGRVLQPAEAITLDTTMDAPTVPGEKDAHIFITVEGFDRTIQASIKAMIVMPIEADPPFVDIRGGKLRAVTKIVAADGKPFRVLSAGGKAPVFAGADGKPVAAPTAPQASVSLVADFAGVPNDQLMQYWVVETDRDDCPIVPVQVRHEVTGVKFDATSAQRRWMWGESLLNAGRVAPGAKFPAVFEFSKYDPPGTKSPPPANWGKVLLVKSLSPLLTAELVSTDTRGDKVVVNLQLTASPDASGKCIYAPIEVTTASGKGRCFVTASVRPAAAATAASAAPGAGAASGAPATGGDRK